MNRQWRCWISLVLFSLMLGAGCAYRAEGPRLKAPQGPVPADVLARYERLRMLNSEVFSVKASGDLRMENHKGIQSAEIALMVVRPDKMRLTILGLTGLPIADMASDGRTLTLVDHTSGQHYREALRSGSLSPILDLPIQPSDAIAILCGAIPERIPKTLQLDRPDADSLRQMTVFNEQGDATLQLLIDDVQQKVREIVCFDDRGDEAYRVRIEDETVIDGVPIPSKLVFQRNTEASLRIRLNRIWVNAGAPPDIFVLNP